MRQDNLSIHLLGRFSVRRAGEEIPQASFGGRLVRTLVRILAVEAGAFRSKEVLAENLWGAQQPSNAAANLEVLVSRARRALEDPGVIRTGPGGYSLDPERCRVDAQAFLERVVAGSELMRAGQEAAALRTYLEALEIWQGEPLPEDAYAEWAQGPRRVLQRAITTALEAGAVAALSLRDPHQAIQLADRAVAEEPLRESAHLLLIEALAASGDQAAALAAFDIMRKRFAEELGLDPSDAAWKVQARVLSGVPHSAHALRQARAESIPSTGSLAFVGRQKELENVLGAIENGSPVFLTGPSGAGKSRLLAEVRSRSSMVTLWARAFPADQSEAWSLAQTVLSDALSLDPDAAGAVPDASAAAFAQLLPHLDLGRAGGGSLDGRSARSLAMEGGVRVVGAAAPSGVLLLLDDLQWADPTSLRLIELLLRRSPQVRVVAAFRSDEPDDSLSSFLAAIRAAWTTTEVALGPLDPTAIEALVDDEATAAAISQGTDRLPLTVGNVLNDMGRAGAVTAGSDGQWRVRAQNAATFAREASRAGQLHAIALRLKRLPLRRRLTIQVLAALGRASPARLLATAVDASESATLENLDILARAGFVRSAEEGWVLAHDSLREGILAALQPGERVALHGRIAGALDEQQADLSERAFHLAGAGNTSAAVEVYVAAARASLARYANDEAVALATSGMTLDPKERVSVELLRIRAEARARGGELEEA
ncbi:MAG: AAA family ATPase, partial [Actinomycetota bacterium]|nr:AAA family ATPase [Actinomycetota bacterium]